jgi:hypothetical protein
MKGNYMTQENYLPAAFEAATQEAKIPKQWYVVLAKKVPYYTSSGTYGFWSFDTYVVAFKEYPTEELAQAAAEQVRRLAKELADQSCCEYPGSPEYSLFVTNEIPQNNYGLRYNE